MSVGIRQLVFSVFASVLFAASPAAAQSGIAGGLGLLAVQAQVTADPSAEPAEKPPTTAEALAAVDRILELWPELVGTLPEGDPRYNAGDIGHVSTCTRVNFVIRKVMERRMIGGMEKNGITIPKDPTSGSPRPIDADTNGGKERVVSRARLEALQLDTDLIRSYFETVMAKIGKKAPVNPDGLSVADWKRIKVMLKAMELAFQ